METLILTDGDGDALLVRVVGDGESDHGVMVTADQAYDSGKVYLSLLQAVKLRDWLTEWVESMQFKED